MNRNGKEPNMYLVSEARDNWAMDNWAVDNWATDVRAVDSFQFADALAYMVVSESVDALAGTTVCGRFRLSLLLEKSTNIKTEFTGIWLIVVLDGNGIGGADGGISPSIVIDSTVISPAMWMNWAAFSGKRWLNSQKCLPLMATLKQLLWAKISISKYWPRTIGQPPVRSSAPQDWFFIWLRTMTFWSGRMLKCKLMSSHGPSAGPVCTLIWMNCVNICGMRPRMRIITPCDRPPGIFPRYGNFWKRRAK